MGIKKYEVEGKEFWRVYVHVCSKKNRKIRSQKVITGITSEDEAIRLDKKWSMWASAEVAKLENEGLTWGEVVEAWELWYRKYPSSRWDKTTVRDYVAITQNWTGDWLKIPVVKLTVSDGFQMIERAREQGASVKRLYQIKSTVNVIFKWGMSAGKIVGKDHSPLFSIDLPKSDAEAEPEILSLDEFTELIERARTTEHDWYPVWKVDAHTGLRAGELDGLRKEDIEMISRNEALTLDRSTQEKKNYGLIRVQRQWRQKMRSYGPLKGRYWRTVPISSQLFWFLIEYLENDFGSDNHGRRVFPIFPELQRGTQAAVLRNFCEHQGIKSIKFHTIRACFATHLLASGVSETTVMKIGGWKDRETMMVYIRLAGIDEAGATESLDLRPKDAPIKGHEFKNVVNLFARS